MTIEEATEILKEWDGYFVGYSSDDVTKALDIAIKALEQDSEKRYNRLFDALKFNWMINCEHDDKLTDKIERCEAALTTLHNLGFNLCTGEVEKRKNETIKD